MMLTLPAVVDVPLRADADGTIRVGDSRVTLSAVVIRYQVGDSPEDIHAAFPGVSLAEIYTVIAYYLSHRAEVDAYVRQAEETAAARRRDAEANDPRAAEFNARMRAQLAEKRDPRG
ncbi:MAG: DUF433 domain-containing protein [Anaerolineae bacterium]|nr:DUF433 domain-containing protein [Anaerolineae bacterium]